MTSEFRPREVPPQLDGVLRLILALAGGDLSARGELSARGDEFDAVMGGLNMVAEELELTFEDVRRRSIELEAANAELKAAQSQLAETAKLASLGEIAAGIAHELNQPLGIIQLYCESALGSLTNANAASFASTAGTAADQIGTALGQVRRASEIVEHVRAFARQGPSTDTALVNIQDLVAGGLLLSRRQLTELNIEFIERVDPALPPLSCREHRVQQVIFNLVSNARDAVAGIDEARIEIDVHGSGTDVIFEVVDNGPGVADPNLDLIMDPFFTTKPAGMGMGLGLAICQSIAHEHGGSLSHERRSDLTVFTLKLPRGGVGPCASFSSTTSP